MHAAHKAEGVWGGVERRPVRSPRSLEWHGAGGAARQQERLPRASAPQEPLQASTRTAKSEARSSIEASLPRRAAATGRQRWRTTARYWH